MFLFKFFVTNVFSKYTYHNKAAIKIRFIEFSFYFEQEFGIFWINIRAHPTAAVIIMDNHRTKDDAVDAKKRKIIVFSDQ